jgi:hypothetical protein
MDLNQIRDEDRAEDAHHRSDAKVAICFVNATIAKLDAVRFKIICRETGYTGYLDLVRICALETCKWGNTYAMPTSRRMKIRQIMEWTSYSKHNLYQKQLVSERFVQTSLA